MDYVTVDEVKNSQELMGVNFADYDVIKAIPAASRAVENYTGRPTFGTTVGTRYYTPQEARYLTIDDLVTVGSVTTDNNGDGTFETVWTQNTNYVLEPLNNPAIGWPYTQLRVHPLSGLWLPPWPRSVQVTGTFGWPSVPESIYTATLILAAQTVKRVREAPFGVVGLGIDNIAVRISSVDTQLRQHLDPYVQGAGVLAA